jgi:signal transduction histidine kinase
MKTEMAVSNIQENTGQSATRIANEFQTPLGVILSAGELLESYFERLTPDRRRLALEDILSAARQMNKTMDLLTAFENELSRNSKSTASEQLMISNQKHVKPTPRSRLRQSPQPRL